MHDPDFNSFAGRLAACTPKPSQHTVHRHSNLQHPVRDPDPNSYAGRLLAKEPKLEADFSRAPGSIPKSQVRVVNRYCSTVLHAPNRAARNLCGRLQLPPVTIKFVAACCAL